MIKGISYWSMEHGLAGTHSIRAALEQAQLAGFEGLELCIAVDGVLTPATSLSECEKIRSLIAESGLVVETLASGMSWTYSPTSNDEQVRDQAIDLHVAAIQRAAWLGCQALLFVPGVVKSPITPREIVRNDVALKRAKVAVARLLETAEECAVDLCLENVWNGMFTSPQELATFVDSFSSDRLGVYFDVGNVLRYHQHPPHWIEMLSHRIKRVHLKDFTERFGWEGSYQFCELGGGDVPWQETMQALDAVGYDSTLVAEIMPYWEGVLEQTSMAMDAILCFSQAQGQASQHRVDFAESSNEKPHLRDARLPASLRQSS
ncbi:MAG: sugar phosphate isomerase/epimerase family protein [Bythopirellula sp.]|nr:sugar phosphate isomerase/epimerase family protein [Bythopirellula sp.]